MGVLVKADGDTVEVGRYRITESSTPLAGGDSSGAVGTIDLDIQQPSTRFLDYGEWTEVYRNLATNPSFEAISGTSAVQGNILPNPSFELNSNGWSGAGSGAPTPVRVTTQSLFGSASLEVACSGTSSGQGAYTTTRPVAAVGVTYTASIYIRGEAGKRARIEFGAWNGSSVMIGGARVLGPSVTLSGGWERLEVTMTTPVGTATVDIVIRNIDAVAHTFYLDGAMISASPAVEPYFDGDTQPRLRENRMLNPSPTSVAGSSTWLNAGGASSVITTGERGQAAIRQTRTSNSAAIAIYGQRNQPLMPIIIPGETWTLSLTARASVDGLGGNGIAMGVVAANNTAFLHGASQVLNLTTQEQRYSFTITIPAASPNTGQIMSPRVGWITTAGVIGDWIEISEVLLEKTSESLPFFDGGHPLGPQYGGAWLGSTDASPSYLYDIDLTTAWSGTAHASPSALQGVGVTGVLALSNLDIAAVSTESWAAHGDRSVRLIPKSSVANNNSAAVLQIVSGTPGNTTYTATAKMRIDKPQTGTLDPLARTLFLSMGANTYASTPAPNVPGVHEVTVTGTTPPAGGTIYAMAVNGATVGNGDIWIDELMFTKGPYDGPYFDGNTPDNGSATRRYDWIGAVNASQSVQEERTITFASRPRNTFLLSEKQIEFIDTSRGSTLGTIRQIENNRDAEFPWHITANTRLGDFNIEVQALPVSGTLESAFEYYCALANIDSDIRVDPSIASTPVNFPGWRGNLWTHMKMMATGISADLNLISNVVVLRPVRQFVALTDRETSATPSLDNTDLALKQEVIWYDTERVSSGLIYPPGGWNPEVRVLSVNAGQTVETTLEVPASITSIEQPVAMASVAPGYSASSVYTVVGDDNIVIQPAQWAAYGGSLSVAISDDTRSLIVTMTGATGLVQINGQPMKTFRIALSAGTSDSTYSTLRIVGDSIQLNQQSLIIPTGVEPWRTGQEFAPTIDNPFLNTLDDAYSAGVRGARRHSGKTFSLSATVTAVNRRGERGTANYPPYSYAQSLWDAATYGGVKAINAGMTYSERAAIFYAEVQDDFDNQVFGNVVGARYYDRASARWYRVRDASTEWGIMNINADDDLLFGDVQKRFDSYTYGQVKLLELGGYSYYEANVRGIE